jgi:hypothetical protein
VKTNLTQRRIKARKASACGLCKPWKQGWADKKTVRDNNRRNHVQARQRLDDSTKHRKPRESGSPDMTDNRCPEIVWQMACETRAFDPQRPQDGVVHQFS